MQVEVMIARLLGSLILIAVGLMAVVQDAHDVKGEAETFASPNEAAHAGFKDRFGASALGSCESTPMPAPSDVGALCYLRDQTLSTDTFVVYSSRHYFIADADSWLGVRLLNGGWAVYAFGYCSIFYCRITDPEGVVIEGMPDGDVTCDGRTDSLDAEAILQQVAGLHAELACSFQFVDKHPGLTATDAMIILQVEAGFIPGLPLPR